MELVCERKHGKIYQADPWCYYEISAASLAKKERELISLIGKASLKEFSTDELTTLFIET